VHAGWCATGGSRRGCQPADIHVGSYLRIKGEERDGVFVAAEITIWLAESKPASAPK
jgi:hypothetical protein